MPISTHTLSCPRLLRASMNTGLTRIAPPVVMDCRNKSGNDNQGGRMRAIGLGNATRGESG